MPYTYTELDPATDQPLKPAAQAPAQQPPAQQPPAQQPPAQQPFDIEKFAAASADRSMMEASRRGTPSQQNWEDARKQAWEAAFRAVQEQKQAEANRQGELTKQIAMRNVEQFGPREMTAEESKDAIPLLNVHNQIMMLHNQNMDIPANHAYRNVVSGGPAAAIGQATDERVRLYETTRDGLITTVARGLGMDTGSAAGKEQAQQLFSRLMPGPGDSVEMAARKTADMNQMELNQLKAQIDALPSNVDTTQLREAYKRSYQDYARLVTQYGSDAQRNYPAPSPEQLWGKQAGQTADSPAIVPVQPAVKAGVSDTTSATLNSAILNTPSQALVSGTPPNQSGSTLQSSPPDPALAAAAQTAGQYVGGSSVMTPQNMPATQGSIGQVAVAPSAQQSSQQSFTPTPIYAAGGPSPAGQVAGQVEQAVGQGAQATLGWLQSLLPEHWNQTGGQFNQ